MPILVFFLVLLSATFHAIWNFSAKKVSGNLCVLYLGLLFAIILLLPLLFTLPSAEFLKTEAYPFIITSGAIHAIYTLVLGKAYQYGDLSTAYPIARGIGVGGTALAASFLLIDEISTFGTIGIISISLGTFLIGFTHFNNRANYRGFVFAVLVGITIISYSIVDKLGVGIINPIAYIYGMFSISMLCLTPYVVSKKRNDLLYALKYYKKYIGIIGIGSSTTYLLILFIFQISKVSYVVALRELSVAIGAILGFKLLNEKYNGKKLIGIVLLVLGIISIKMA